MDLQVGLFCAAVAVFSAFIIYLMITLSVSSKPTFEEAKANRRKIIRQFQEENKVSIDKSKDKKPKKPNKKIKDKKDPNEIVEGGNVEPILENEIKEQEQPEIISSQSTYTGNESKMESFIFKIKEKNKFVQQEIPQEQVDSPENVAVIQQNKTIVKVKTSMEKIMDVNTVKENKKKKKEKEEKIKEKEIEKNIEQIETHTPKELSYEIDSSQASDSSQNIAPQTVANRQQIIIKKPSKKKRSEITSLNQLKNEKEAVSISLIVSLIKKAELSNSEIQMLIESLFNDQQDDDSEWLKGRQDPVIKLKKQLSDIEQTLKDEKEVNIGLQAKLRELRAELTNDRVATRNAEEQAINLQNELRSLSHKLHTMTEEKNTLAVNVQQLQNKLSEEQMKIKLKEEQIMKQRITEENSHETVLALQSQVNQLSNKLQENVRIIEEYQKMQTEMTRAYEGSQFNVKELQAKLKTKERALADAKADIDNHIISNKDLYEQIEHLTNQLKNQCQEINVLREKNETFKMNAENWENGFSYNNKQGITELEERLEEKSSQVEQLTNELEFNINKIQELNVNLTRSKSDTTKYQMLFEKANTEITVLKEKINEASRPLQDDIIAQLKNSLNEKNKEILLLKSEIEICKQRNNALRNKNWKVVEALTKAENALQTKIRNEQNTNEQNLYVREESNVEVQKIHGTINRLIKHLYPEIIVDENKESTDEWLASLEKAVMSRAVNGEEKINSSSELQAHNNQLQALVVHYKGIITDTERMLNQLQKHVEIEESRWKGKIKSLEDEIAKLRSNHTSDVFLHP